MKTRAFVIFSMGLMGSLAMLLVAACGGGGPEQKEVKLKLEDGKLMPQTVQAKQGDMVMLRIEAHEPGDLHLHGYDIEREVVAGQVTEMDFTADATGRFKITFHEKEGDGHGTPGAAGGHAEEEEKEVGFLEVLPR